MNFLICDDDNNNTETLKTLLHKYFEDKQITINITSFNNPDECMKDIKNNHYDFYLLDIIMPDITGLDIAKTIRAANDNSVIIFISNSESYHMQAFSLEVLHYISKPVDYGQLSRALDRGFIYLKGMKENDTAVNIDIPTKNGMFVAKDTDIEFIESRKHTLIFHLVNNQVLETITSTLSLSKLSEILPNDKFLTPYKGYLVNVDFIDHIEKYSLTMTCGTQIPIPIRQFGNVFNEYMKKVR